MTDAKDPLLTAALLAQTGQPVGPAPSDDELRAWANRSLNERRREEVESHIAHCPATCARATTFLGHDSLAPANHWRVWFGKLFELIGDPRGPIVVGVGGVVVLAFLTVDYLRTPTTRAPDTLPSVERSATTDINDWRMAAFMSGFLAPDDAQQAMLMNAATVPANCLDGNLCAQLPGLVRELGATLRQLDINCGANGAAGANTRPDLERLEPRLRASLELAPWSQVAADLLRVLREQPQAACAELETLKQRGFTPSHLN